MGMFKDKNILEGGDQRTSEVFNVKIPFCAKLCILGKCAKEQWRQELSESIGLERQTDMTRGGLEGFVQLWEPYMKVIVSGE